MTSFDVEFRGYVFRSAIEIIKDITPDGGIFIFDQKTIKYNHGSNCNKILVSLCFDTSKLKYKLTNGPVSVNFDLAELYSKVNKCKKRSTLQIEKQCETDDIFLKFNNFSSSSNPRIVKVQQSPSERNSYKSPIGSDDESPISIMSILEFKEYCDSFGKNDRGSPIGIDVGANWLQMHSEDDSGSVVDQLISCRYPELEDDVVMDKIFTVRIDRNVFKILSRLSNPSPTGNMSFYYYENDEFYSLRISSPIGYTAEINIYFKTPKEES